MFSSNLKPFESLYDSLLYPANSLCLPHAPNLPSAKATSSTIAWTFRSFKVSSALAISFPSFNNAPHLTCLPDYYSSFRKQTLYRSINLCGLTGIL